MRKIKNESTLCDELGVNSIAEVNSNHAKTLQKIYPRIDPELLRALSNQFPNFKEIANTSINAASTVCCKGIEGNDRSNGDVMRGYNKIIDSSLKVYESEERPLAEREKAFEQAMNSADKMAKKDTENKSFYVSLLKFAMFAIAAVPLGILILFKFALGGARKA